MLFNSIAFLLFFPVVCVVYFLLPYRYRWLFLLLASYFFYMNWIPVYAILKFASTLTTYLCALFIERSHGRRARQKLFLQLSLVFNFGILFIFKYYNFINESVFAALGQAGMRWEVPNLDILLPVGISFYTFQAVGYTIDVYRGDIKAEKHFGIYALFVSFFPQLVAGPIERVAHMLPQFHRKHDFNYERFLIGTREMLWGFFMKVCVADRLAIYVNAVYGNVDKHHGTTFIIATFLFAIQIYCDFAGYSSIAKGTARILGFDLMENFRRPYFAQSISEFWKRWHISLSTWFRDYVYVPLGGNRVSPMTHLFNLFITFLVSGIWHGANWTFVIWGALHGLFLVVGVLSQKLFHRRDTNAKNALRPATFSFKALINILTTFILVNLGWVFFRADNLADATHVIQQIFTTQGTPFLNKTELLFAGVCIVILLLKEIKDEFNWNISLLSNDNLYVRTASYIVMMYLIVLFGVVDSNQFIYFQF